MFRGLTQQPGREQTAVQSQPDPGTDGNTKSDVVSIRVNAPSIPVESGTTAIYDRARLIYFRARSNRRVRPASII